MRITRVLAALAISLIAACASVPRGPAATRYDVLITNARIVDGTGNPWYRGTVAIRGDRIAYVGPSIVGLTARRVIDAHDQVVAPGFIDMLGHSEFSILRGPHAVSKVTQGITSEITGEVSSAWPIVALGEQPNPRYPWRSLGEYFGHLEKTRWCVWRWNRTDLSAQRVLLD
jgi:N-acyl-D-amino-acid deacylase